MVRAARLAEARARCRPRPLTLRGARRAKDVSHHARGAGAGAGGRCTASVVDACCGSGGNTLGFARAGCSVTAIDLEPERIDAEARHNAQLYGVAERVRF